MKMTLEEKSKARACAWVLLQLARLDQSRFNDEWINFFIKSALRSGLGLESVIHTLKKWHQVARKEEEFGKVKADNVLKPYLNHLQKILHRRRKKHNLAKDEKGKLVTTYLPSQYPGIWPEEKDFSMRKYLDNKIAKVADLRREINETGNFSRRKEVAGKIKAMHDIFRGNIQAVIRKHFVK